MSKPVLKMTTVNLSEAARRANLISSEISNDQLELYYTELEAQAYRVTESQRVATEASATASIEQGKYVLLQMQFLRYASQLSNTVGAEGGWMSPYRDVNGNILIDNPMTIKDVRAAARVHHQQISKAVENSDLDTSGLFQDDEE